MNRNNGQRGHPQPVTSSPEDAAPITQDRAAQEQGTQEQDAENEATATPREGWQRMLAPKNGTAWMRRLAVGAAACLLFAFLLFSAWHDRSGPDERRVVTATTQAAVAPETLLRQAQAAAQRQERRRQMALRARALAEKRAQQETRRRRQLAMGQRASTTELRQAGGQPTPTSRFRTLSPSSSSATAAGQAEPSGRSNHGSSRDELRERLLADAIERQEQRTARGEAVATSREAPLPLIARAPSVYAPIRAVFHPSPGLLLRAGTSIPATLITHISSEVAGPVQAVVNHTVYGFGNAEIDQRQPIIPAGTRLFGFNEGRASLGDRRLAIAWNRLQFADGRTLVLERVATTDGQGTAGVQARVDNRWPSFYFHAFLTSITGATAQLSQRRGSRGNGELSRGEEAAAALGRNLSEVTRQVTERNLSRAPILEVQAGASLVVMLTEDLVFMQPPKPPEHSRPESR